MAHVHDFFPTSFFTTLRDGSTVSLFSPALFYNALPSQLRTCMPFQPLPKPLFCGGLAWYVFYLPHVPF